MQCRSSLTLPAGRRCRPASGYWLSLALPGLARPPILPHRGTGTSAARSPDGRTPHSTPLPGKTTPTINARKSHNASEQIWNIPRRSAECQPPRDVRGFPRAVLRVRWVPRTVFAAVGWSAVVDRCRTV
eukprot:5436886-Pyramimonas_sp.AAC.1